MRNSKLVPQKEDYVKLMLRSSDFSTAGVAEMRPKCTRASDSLRLALLFATSCNLTQWRPPGSDLSHKDGRDDRADAIGGMERLETSPARHRYPRLTAKVAASSQDPTGDGARRLAQAGAFLTHRAHQPVGAMSPSTILQPLGATKKLQPSHWWPSFGVA